MTIQEPKDLSGDIVYDHLKSKVLPGNTLIGGIITHKKIVKFDEPRSIIEVHVHDKDKKLSKYTYNYLKLKKMIQKSQVDVEDYIDSSEVIDVST